MMRCKAFRWEEMFAILLMKSAKPQVVKTKYFYP